MKNLLLPLLLVVTYLTSAQVGIGTTAPDASAAIEVSSTTAGMLIPRMDQTQRDAIALPATGLLIYQTNNAPGFYYYNGTIWITFGGSDNDWTVVGNDMYNANTGNVGIGNTTPSAKFHITGTTTPSSSGGTVNLLNEDFTGYSLTENNSSTGCTTSDGWDITTTGDANTNCTSCAGSYLYIDSDESGCSQNATSIVSITTNPTSTSIDISFDYRYNDYTGADDAFRVYLYQETAPAGQVGADLINTTTDANTSYSSTETVIAGNSYSLRFEYTGIYDYGATVDNVLVTEASVPSAGSYMFRLEDGQEQAGYVLTSDANGNATWAAASGGGGGTDSQTLSISGNNLTISNGNTITLPSGGGGSYTFDNGLTLTGSNVQLGGTLITDTTITIGDNDFVINGNSTTGFTGEMTLNGNNRVIFDTEVDEDYINFGSGAFVDGDDGTTFNDTGNSIYTKDFVAGFHNGSSGGTAIALGSIEYIVDGTNELFFQGSAFSPMTNLGADLGAGNGFQSGPVRNWDDVYADDFVATSGTTYNRIASSKNDDLTNSLAKILQLKPITYKELPQNIGSRMTDENERDSKLGFYASELLEVIPEAIKKSDWVTLKEGDDQVKMSIPNPTGIMYNQIIPVLVKGMQEQQQQIEELTKLVSKLIGEKKN